MKYNIYSFKDIHQGFMGLTLCLNDAICYRNVVNLLKEGNNDFVKNPSDFSLYKMGSFDTESGVIENKVEFMTDFQALVDSLASTSK